MNQIDPSSVADAMVIRPALPDDLDALCALKLACFRETFGPTGFAIPYPAADLALFERDAYGPAKVASELAEPSHATWVAVNGAGAMVGYVHVGPCKLPHDDLAAGDHELYQLYLRRDAQGAGLGSRLMDLSLNWMEARTREAGGRALWLGVWSGNDRAQHVYQAHGFAIVGGYQFAVGDWRDDEFIMRRATTIEGRDGSW